MIYCLWSEWWRSGMQSTAGFFQSWEFKPDSLTIAPFRFGRKKKKKIEKASNISYSPFFNM